jgi:Sec-independent protein translocase protein TatA
MGSAIREFRHVLKGDAGQEQRQSEEEKQPPEIPPPS